jgi:hypothetical protein
MNEASLEVYQSRALQLANAMRLCAEDCPSYASAVALLAVHSAISYNDALHIRLTGGRPNSENHKDAFRSTKKACQKAKIDSAGLRHLERLLSIKTDISYGNKAVRVEHAQVLNIEAQRFQAWAERNLAIERTIQ